MKVLVVEDNIPLAKNIVEYLKIKDIRSEHLYDGKKALESILSSHYDAVILDINLPSMDWLSLCRTLRASNNATPILMLTSRNATKDVVTWLNDWADDYLGKPFDLEELVSRLEALTRRCASNKGSIVRIHDLEINLLKRSVTKGKKEITLSTLEFDLLKYLIQHQGTPIDRKTLFEHVWGDFDNHMFSRSVDVYVSSLRKKIGEHIIQTKKWFGYVIE